MLRSALLSLCLGMMAPAAATADAPRIAVDIPPVGSLVAQVMGELGTPEFFVAPGASPHGQTLRPSDAALLAEADLVVWIGPVLMPEMAGRLATLAPDTATLELADVPGTGLLPIRDRDDFGAGDAHGSGSGHGAHRDVHDDHSGHDAHDHGPLDPHVWLDPDNAAIWLGAIAETLAMQDPDNAATYRANAADSAARIADGTARIEARLAPVADRPFATAHDAFQYFEARFRLSSVATISLGDGARPGARQVAGIRDRLDDAGVTCILADPREGTSLVAPVTEGRQVRVATIDPTAADLPPGPALYEDLLGSLAGALADCLEGGT